jgi:hypothetical protein
MISYLRNRLIVAIKFKAIHRIKRLARETLSYPAKATTKEEIRPLRIILGEDTSSRLNASTRNYQM